MSYKNAHRLVELVCKLHKDKIPCLEVQIMDTTMANIYACFKVVFEEGLNKTMMTHKGHLSASLVRYKNRCRAQCQNRQPLEENID